MVSRIIKEPDVTRSAITREWFRDWFGEEYLALYPHRDEEEARAAVRLYLEVAGSPANTSVLDVACGAGRHLRALRRAGLHAVGLDLSATLLRNARASDGRDPLVRGDMRGLPFRRESFDGLTSFFTSFGYFRHPDDDRTVLREMRRVLRPGGTFMLDFLNADRIRRELVPEDVLDAAQGRVVQRRSIDGDSVVKRIRFEPADGRESTEFEERVRLYSCADLQALLAEARLTTTLDFGDYEGAAFTTSAPRLILAGRAEGSLHGEET